MCVPRSITPTLVSVAHSLKTQKRSRGSQRWAFDLEFAPMTRAEWQPIFAFLVKQRGRYGTFQWTLPTPLLTPLGSLGGSPVVNNNAGSPTASQAGTRALWTSGWTAALSAALKAGDFLLPAGGSGKVYMATEDVGTDSNGFASIQIEPALMDDIAHGAALTVSSVPFTVSITKDSLESALALGPQYGINLELIEDV